MQVRLGPTPDLLDQNFLGIGICLRYALKTTGAR